MKTEKPTVREICAMFDLAMTAEDGGLCSNAAFNAAEKHGWKWEDDEQFCGWALGATEPEIAAEGKRRFLASLNR
jgi:hypothetical protein